MDLIKEVSKLPVTNIDCLAKTSCGLGKHELSIFYGIFDILKPKRFLEIGTAFGSTIYELATYSPKCKFHTVDRALRYKGEFPSNIKFHRADSSRFLYNGICNIDVTFIDACHSPAHVAIDTYNAMRLTKDEGLIVWHDYTLGKNSGVRIAIDELGIKINKFPETTLAFTFNEKMI